MSKKPSKGSSIALRAQRERLFAEQRGLCHWCGQPMVLFRGTGRESLPPDAATLDHLDDKWSPLRGTFRGQRRRVAACRRCNERRSRDNQARMPTEEVHRRIQEGHARRRARHTAGEPASPAWSAD